MDELTLVCNGHKISGWQGIRVTRGIERMPGDFEISATERYPGAADVPVQPGDTCKVLLGADLVLTGYVDQYIPQIQGSDHTIRIAGRGKCEDLIDCAAEWPGSQINGSTTLGIAQRIAKPYGITVSGEKGLGITQIILMYGESAWEIIERMCRYSALLAVEQPDGNLLLTHVGTATHASGFAQGQNVEIAAIAYTMDQRYSEYVALMMSTNLYGDLGGGEFRLSTVKDPGCSRHRRRVIIAEAQAGGQAVAIKRATWEMNRRAARSTAIRLTCDSWRDSAGKLWTPNMLAPVKLPALKLPSVSWVIGEVTYERDERGSRAHLVLMPAAAFAPEPISLMPVFADVPFIPQASAGNR